MHGFLQSLKHALIGLTVTFVTFLGGALMFVGAHSAKAGEHGTGMSVVELFTSQGCSSCPPADALLKTYVDQPGVLALSYSVDYWNYIGWHDTFSNPRYSKRQRAYARLWGVRSVYTPQLVINGVAHVNGAVKVLIDGELQRTAQTLSNQRSALKAKLLGDRYEISLNPAPQFADDLGVLWLIRVRTKVDVKVERGENRGRLLTYYNVVLDQQKVASVTNRQAAVSFAKPKTPLKAGERYVLMLQVGKNGPILGALEL